MAWTCQITNSATRAPRRVSTFVEGDITINKEWVEYHVKKCDVVVPLVAIANSGAIRH